MQKKEPILIFDTSKLQFLRGQEIARGLLQSGLRIDFPELHFYWPLENGKEYVGLEISLHFYTRVFDLRWRFFHDHPGVDGRVWACRHDYEGSFEWDSDAGQFYPPLPAVFTRTSLKDSAIRKRACKWPLEVSDVMLEKMQAAWKEFLSKLDAISRNPPENKEAP
jgi:hypothetical protein